MLLKIGAILVFLASYIVAIILARREGKKAEQVANLRREIERNAKEQERANEISNRVDNMSIGSVHERLSNLKGK